MRATSIRVRWRRAPTTSSQPRAASCAASCCSVRCTASPCAVSPLRRAERFQTPLGPIAVDRAALRALQDLPQVVESDRAHALEHSLEVQLPFLQTLLGEFSLVPLAVGSASVAEVAEVLERLWGGDETLIVISTDLSHYLGYDEARAVDAATLARIAACASDIDHEEACGATPLNGLLWSARRRKLEVRLLAACNSGDTAGDKDRVVGYSAFGVYHEAERDAGTLLLGIARGAIEQHLFGTASVSASAAWLQAAGRELRHAAQGGRAERLHRQPGGHASPRRRCRRERPGRGLSRSALSRAARGRVAAMRSGSFAPLGAAAARICRRSRSALADRAPARTA